MINFIVVLIAIVGFLLVLVVLIQNPKGGEWMPILAVRQQTRFLVLPIQLTLLKS